MKTYFVVTAVVMHKGKVLMLKKAADDYNYPNKWSFCSGFVKEFEAAEDTVLREIEEETGLSGKLTSEGVLVDIPDEEKGKNWKVMVFGFESSSMDVKLCHENVEFKWVEINEVKDYDGVPGLEKDLKALDLL